MNYELFEIQIVQDMSELAEQYDGAAENEELWAKGAPDEETAQMHLDNAEHCREMAKFYREMAKYPRALFKLFQED